MSYNSIFKIRKLGYSACGREISSVAVGSGGINILLWSQMHGDEPTATMAIFDLFKFFEADDELNSLRALILEKCRLHFIPMLNPDGAEFYQRRNAQGIDINRDFKVLQSPEARILMDYYRELNPDFCFNLHDQSTLWSVTGSGKPASVSLLAPPVDNTLTIPSNRKDAMKIVAALYEKLSKQIPGQIGRWNDEYEPRAAGETFQSLGAATILIESGGFAGDPEKQFLRRLNFEMLLFAFEKIADGSYINQPVEPYESIPLNNKEIFHLLIRNCLIDTGRGIIKADVGLNYEEIKSDMSDDSRVKVYSVADMGDLTNWNAYEVIDASGAMISGSVKPDMLACFSLAVEGRNSISFAGGVKD